MTIFWIFIATFMTAVSGLCVGYEMGRADEYADFRDRTHDAARNGIPLQNLL